jgi:SpoVK/Ycf46/Vps4 family AAA+-type ATPase
LPAPKGVLLFGHPGTGKSLCAKSIATAWGQPLLRLDIGGLKSKFVGESEANIRAALRVAETVAPCVLWVDEIEKALAGSEGAQGDGGVSSDALGTLLSWMQDRAGSVFVVGTANSIQNLPDALTRKGRFDELFFVDLPNEREREQILKVALREFGQDLPELKMSDAVDQVVNATDGFVGAEIASVVPDALYRAFADGERPLELDDVLVAARAVVPLSETAKENIESMQKWANGRCRFATTRTIEQASDVRSIEV